MVWTNMGRLEKQVVTLWKGRGPAEIWMQLFQIMKSLEGREIASTADGAKSQRA